MGIIQKQAIRGTVFSYLGVILGFITTALLFPRILSINEIGLLKLLVSFSVLFAQFGSLGFNSVINRLFPWFRDYSTRHKGFIGFAVIVSMAGFILSAVAYKLYEPVLVRNNFENSSLLVEYSYLIIPLIFATLFFNLLDTYNKVLYDTVLGSFLKEFLQRFLILIAVLLYHFRLLNFESFVWTYTLSIFVPAFVLLWVLIYRGEFSLKIQLSVFHKKMLREMASISLFGFFAGIGGLGIAHIDSIMVNRFLGISMTGIYAITFFFGTLVLIPSRPLIKIATAVLADSWKENNLDNIYKVYYKSCINQSIIGALLFIGLWVNIENIFLILPEEFEAGKYVIFFIALANVFEMSGGVSGMVIGTSEHYKKNALFIFIFLLLIIGLNFTFIPVFGLTGAAMATAIAKFIYTLLRYLFLNQTYGMNPYNYRYFLLIAASAVSYFAGYSLPMMENFIVDFILRSGIVSIVFATLILLLRLSEDLNNYFRDVLKTLRIQR